MGKNTLLSLGFEQSDADESMFVLDTPTQHIIVGVYVEDFLVAASTIEQID
jgi:hypothetical protein